jgi:hypothetical protein
MRLRVEFEPREAGHEFLPEDEAVDRKPWQHE